MRYIPIFVIAGLMLGSVSCPVEAVENANLKKAAAWLSRTIVCETNGEVWKHFSMLAKEEMRWSMTQAIMAVSAEAGKIQVHLYEFNRVRRFCGANDPNEVYGYDGWTGR